MWYAIVARRLIKQYVFFQACATWLPLMVIAFCIEDNCWTYNEETRKHRVFMIQSSVHDLNRRRVVCQFSIYEMTQAFHLQERLGTP